MGQELMGEPGAKGRAEPHQSDKAAEMFDAIRATSHLARIGARTIALGHELRQPLFTIALANENLRLMLESPDTPRELMLRAIDRIAEQLQRSQTLIDMAVKSVPETRPEHCATDLVMAMRSSCRLLDELFENSGVLIEPLHADLSARVALGRIEAEQVFVNVMRNAIDSIQSRRKQGWTGTGRVVIEFDVDRTGVRCVIADNGAGLCASMTEAGFRPLHTTKAAEGTGIGLFICEKMLSAAGGSIRLLPGLTEGAEVEIRLPLLDEG